MSAQMSAQMSASDRNGGDLCDDLCKKIAAFDESLAQMVAVQKIALAEELPRIIKLHVEASLAQGYAVDINSIALIKSTQKVVEPALELRKKVQHLLSSTQ
jgi:hypothetical protein